MSTIQRRNLAVKRKNDHISLGYRVQVIDQVADLDPAAFRYWQARKPEQVGRAYLPDACTDTGARRRHAIGRQGDGRVKARSALARVQGWQRRTSSGLYLITTDLLYRAERFDRLADWERARAAVLQVGHQISPGRHHEYAVEVSADGWVHGHLITDDQAADVAEHADLTAKLLEWGRTSNALEYTHGKPVQAVNCGHDSEGEGWRYAAPGRAAEGVVNHLRAQMDAEAHGRARLPRMSGAQFARVA